VLSARESKRLRALVRREERAESGLFLAEGARVIEDLLNSGLTIRMFIVPESIVDRPEGRNLIVEADQRGLDLRIVPNHEFERLAVTETPRNALAVVEIPAVSPEQILFAPGRAVVLLLDGIQDPGNFGTLVRSAEAFGAAGVLTLPGTVDPWNPKSVRSAAGSSFRIPIVGVSWNDVAQLLHRAEFVVWGASMEGEAVQAPVPERVALVMGNEGAGLSAAARAALDRVVGIPTPGRAESLNVAAAAAILLHELTR
jgi:TrmH family RNA methyltransferase